MIIGLRRGIEPPIPPGYAYSPVLHVPWPVVLDFATVHQVDSWLAALVIRPMIADLAVRGTWRVDTARRVVVQDDLCHAFSLNQSCTRVIFYQADHGQFDCHATPCLPPRPDQPTWFSSGPEHIDHFGLGTAAPPEGVCVSWRYLLRTATALPMQIKADAFSVFAALGSVESLGLPGLMRPDSLLAWVEALAEQMRAVHAQLPPVPTRRVQNGPLLWTVEHRPDSVPVRKPRLVAVNYLPGSGTS
ncbi:hypothetical protein [Streptomyces sp. NPDC101455]|uniref:hypothetical protein n=1 Tax=Streptomyces sp. NPDC101455 TaxID=3366142 RepID=UPI00380853A3